eukprot:Selendium_serpulae@DN3095_c0_g1_i1.p1
MGNSVPKCDTMANPFAGCLRKKRPEDMYFVGVGEKEMQHESRLVVPYWNGAGQLHGVSSLCESLSFPIFLYQAVTVRPGAVPRNCLLHEDWEMDGDPLPNYRITDVPASGFVNRKPEEEPHFIDVGGTLTMAQLMGRHANADTAEPPSYAFMPEAMGGPNLEKLFTGQILHQYQSFRTLRTLKSQQPGRGMGECD